jgi:hypothetical protein
VIRRDVAALLLRRLSFLIFKRRKSSASIQLTFKPYQNLLGKLQTLLPSKPFNSLEAAQVLVKSSDKDPSL